MSAEGERLRFLVPAHFPLSFSKARVAMQPLTVRILCDKHFLRDLRPDLLPAVHICLRKLVQIDRSRWHAAGVRVKKLVGFPWTVYEARLNDGDRLIFTIYRGQTGASDTPQPHLLLWHAGHHDDAVRTAGRRMGLLNPVEENLAEDASGAEVPGLSRRGGTELPLGGAPTQPQSLTPVLADDSGEQLRGVGSLVEIDEADLDRWAESQIDPILHLTPEQRDLTRSAQDQPVFLRGGVGTGKTTVLLYRMLKLMLAGAIDRPAFLTYSSSLASWCRSVFERMPGASKLRPTFTSLARLLSRQFGEPQGGKQAFNAVWRKRNLAGDSEAAWRELRRIRGSAAFHGHQPRTGDDLPAHAEASLRVAYAAYRDKLAGGSDVLDLAWQAYERYRSPSMAGQLPYDAIFIDEAQDLTPIEWLVCILMGDRPRLAFFCADEAQDVLDTRFAWGGVEAAMRLAGHRAPRFRQVELRGNERNATPIASMLQAISSQFGLEAQAECSGQRPGPQPLACVGTLQDLETIARRAGCPILLNLAASIDRDCSDFFWSLDLDHIKGLEFQVLPVWAPKEAWPADKGQARKLYTAISRAQQLVVIVTDDTTIGRFEALGATRAGTRTELAQGLSTHRELIAWDRESAARWKQPDFAQATRWVDAKTCAWKDFRTEIPRWRAEASFGQARAWVEEGFCGWGTFSSRTREWVRFVDPEIAVSWVRDGLCDSSDFAKRVPAWAREASLDQAERWVSTDLATWSDFARHIPKWLTSAQLPTVAAWVSEDLCAWSDVGGRWIDWVPDAAFDLALAWVREEICTWNDLRLRTGEWLGTAPYDVVESWVRDGLTTWSNVRDRVPEWTGTAPLAVVEAWVSEGFCTWDDVSERLAGWADQASFAQVSTWVGAGLCGWESFRHRTQEWVAQSTPEQAIVWLRAGWCEGERVRVRVPAWIEIVTLDQAAALVRSRCCSWDAYQPRLAEWGATATIEQAREWITYRVRSWRDFEPRVREWCSLATLEEASDWVLDGLCTWRDFESRMRAWKASASLQQASDWVTAGLASWKDFEMKLPRWTDEAGRKLVIEWRGQNLISRQVANAALRKIGST